jgi:hypothetical protein
MTRLRRIHLDGIGPTGARFDPVTLDLTDRVGEAAKVALIHLENGGGKSVLLKLVFAAVLPGRRYTVGGARLGDFVLSDDTGHVALEWSIDDGHGGHALLVTGTVLEWRNRTRSADQSNLRQWWYAFRPIEGALDLDTLPTRLGDRRPSRAAFRDRLIEAWHASPGLELADEDSPERWREWLLNHTPLDPELFAYQRSMNADEADAEELFSTVRSGDDFVRMLLKAVADPAEMQSFGDTLASFATQLARRGGLERERAFTVDAVGVLEPLAAAHVAARQAEEAVAVARRDRWSLAARLASAVEQSTREAERLAVAAEADDMRARQFDERAGQLVAQGQELRRREAAFMVAEAKQRLEEAKRHADDAANLAHAWKVVESVIDQATAAADRVRLQRELEQADRQDAPLRAARDDAVRALAARLDDEIRSATREVAGQDTAAEAADAARKGADEHRRKAESKAATLRANATANENRVTEANEACAALVDTGVLQEGEDAATGEERWTFLAIEAESDLSQLKERRQATRTEHEELDTEQQNLMATLVELRASLTESDREHRRLSELARLLAAEDRYAEVLGEARVDLWARGADVTAALLDAVGRSENDLRELAIASRADQLALDALGDGGLLPPSDDVARVWDVLTEARIPATSGWRWLAERDDPDERAHLLANHPVLAGGVVVTDPARLDAARELMIAAGLDLRSVVAVGAAGNLEEPSDPPVWAVPVHRGLYDAAWAADEKLRIEQRLAESAESFAVLERQSASDRELRERLRQFLDQCPAGHIESLATDARNLSERINAVTARWDEIASTIASLKLEAATLEEIVTDLTEKLNAATQNAARCEEQARRDRQAVQWRADATRWRTEAQSLDEEGHNALAAAEAARIAGDIARNQAAEGRRLIASCEDERGELPVVTARRPPDDETPTAVLRRSYQAAVARLESESSGTRLATQLSIAETREADVAKRLKTEPDNIVTQATQLSRDPAAGDPAGRNEAQRRTAREAERLRELATDASGDVKVAEAELRKRSPNERTRWTDLPDDLEPKSAEHAAALDRQVANEQRRVAEQAREAHERSARSTRAAEDANSRALIVSAHLRVLAVDDVPVETAGVHPFDGSLEEAERLVDEQARAYRRTASALTVANDEVARVLECVRSVGLRSDYAGIGGAQTALAEEPAATLVPRAADLARGLEAIRESIDAELAEVHKHREGLIERLSTLVEQRLKLLKLAQRMSTVPEGLNDWSGKPFLAIQFQTPEQATLAARMGVAIDAAVNAEKRDPTAIVLNAVRSAVVRRTPEGEQAFTVAIMKPNAAMFDTTVGVERLSTEFSGGQRLTAAILLYCTLASLRAHVRGQERVADPGVLFLDNPIGKANADYLLDLQIAVADRRCVQLLYTTGISDPEVQAFFDTVVRLRNDADLRRHLNYIVLDEHIASVAAGGRALADTAGYVSASRLTAVPLH